MQTKYAVLTNSFQMDPEIDSTLSMHVLQSHMYRKMGEADGTALRTDNSTDIIVAEHEVRVECGCHT
jgi:hypothetical protein